jgi:hypothetical protein
VIDPTTETALSLAEVAALLPPGRRGKRPHLSCVLRWITRGAPGPDGKPVRLRAARVGGRWFSSREAVAEFIEALTPRFDAPAAEAPRPASKRRRASERAARELERAGV